MDICRWNYSGTRRKLRNRVSPWAHSNKSCQSDRPLDSCCVLICCAASFALGSFTRRRSSDGVDSTKSGLTGPVASRRCGFCHRGVARNTCFERVTYWFSDPRDCVGNRWTFIGSLDRLHRAGLTLPTHLYGDWRLHDVASCERGCVVVGIDHRDHYLCRGWRTDRPSRTSASRSLSRLGDLGICPSRLLRLLQ